MISIIEEQRIFEERKAHFDRIPTSSSFADEEKSEAKLLREKRIAIIKDNVGKVSRRKIADMCGLSYSNLTTFCKRHGVYLSVKK